jgi:hypothetical protein
MRYIPIRIVHIPYNINPGDVLPVIEFYPDALRAELDFEFSD